ncbi:MAG: DUF6308 family protein [Chloroflexota bacterium]
MIAVRLVLGGEEVDRTIENADALLRQYRQDNGCYYLDHQSITPQNRLVPEDIAVTLLVNSQAGWRAFRSLQLYGASIELDSLPSKSLEQTTPEERRQIKDVIVKLTGWPGFAASLATKVLHKKRPDLIPMLDNQAIFGAYMSPNWPKIPARSDSIKDGVLILRALNLIFHDLTREENRLSWRALQAIEPTRTKIQLFDSVWWMYFRVTQPV